MEMIDRVAKAMQASKAWPVVFDAGSAEVLARAAIEAMREPTEAMLLACWPLYHPWGKNAPKPEDRPEQIANLKETVTAEWRAMLSEALSPSLKEQDRTP